jgi:hypothetical protein
LTRSKNQKSRTTVVVSASKLPQQHDPFDRAQTKLAPSCKNAFEIMKNSQKKISVTTDLSPVAHNSDRPPAKRPKKKLTKKSRKAASETVKEVRSGAWQWFAIEIIDKVRHGICLVETADGKPCNTTVRTGSSTTALWTHLRVQHGIRDGKPPVSLFTLPFQFCSVRPNDKHTYCYGFIL